MTATASRRVRSRPAIAIHLLLAAVAYLPLLGTARGRLAADTRQAVYLDPGRFLVDALSMWDPSRDLGTVTHQNIVLVWPMGVFYWLAEQVGAPLWAAQRLWLGSILFGAGAGVLYLARTIRWTGGPRPHEQPATLTWLGPLVAALAYAMSPYALQYGTRTSVLLLPWAALPWLIGLTARALETRGWRHPGLIALVVLGIAVNATALALALLGPAVWVAWSVWGSKQVAPGAAAGTVGRIAVLGVVTSSWWVVALLIEGRYGLPILSYTETIDQVASTSAATEVLRGLGYWVPYLSQYRYPEVSGAEVYLERWPVLALQLAVVVLAFAGTAVMRWGHRAFFAGLVVVGVVVGVGAYPTNDPSPLGAVFHDFARTGGIGLALRSTTRAAPLALLGLAFLLGAGVDALARRARRSGVVVGAGVGLVVVSLAPTIAGTQLVDPLYSRSEQLPAYWIDALDRADDQAGTGRLLELPGTRYAAYRWGNTYEPVTAGLAETPSAWREQIPYGGAGSAELLAALDNQLQEGRLTPEALAPVARLLGVSQLLLRNDLAYERYDVVTPDRVWSLVEDPPSGLGVPQGFGPVAVNEPDPAHARSDQPVPADPTATYPAVALVPVEASPGLLQRVPVADTVILDGSGDGIVDAAGAGVIDGLAPVLYAASTAEDPELLERVLDEGGRIVLTDTNRRRVRRWRSIRNTTGVTLRPDEDPRDDDSGYGGEAPLEVFPGAGVEWQTVAAPEGARVSATRYGNPLWFEAALRPAVVLDGDPATAWTVGPTIGGIGDRVTVELDEPLRTDHLVLHASTKQTALTEVDLRFDDGPPVRVVLDDSSRSAAGQRVDVGPRTFSTLSVELRGTRTPPGVEPEPVGIAEIELDRPDGSRVLVDPIVQLPTALTQRLGAASLDLPLSVVLTRLRGDLTGPPLFEEEPVIVRSLHLPAARQLTLTGDARLRPDVPSAWPASDPADPADPAACRSDLVSIDGVAVPVRALPGDGLAGCAPVALDAGQHHIRTHRAADVDVDQLVLSSEAGGAPSSVDADGTPALPPPSPRPGISWDEQAHTEISVESDAADGPTWLVLGQSLNEGWEAALEGTDLGAPVLLNGFANGFFVPETDDPTRIDLSWAPQRSMRIALAVSAAGILAALVVSVRGRRWQPAPATGRAVPLLDAPWTAVPELPWVRAGIVAGAAASAALLLVGPLWGLAAGAVVLSTARSPHGRGLLAGAIVVSMTAALGSVVLQRLDHREQEPFAFFTGLHGPHRLALFGLILLAVEVTLRRASAALPVDPIGSLRSGWRRLANRTTPEEESTAPPPGPELRKAFLRAWAAGIVPATLLYAWMVTGGTWRLFDQHPTADFYDGQAHALLAGRLDLPADLLGIEGFASGGRHHMYQGPFPALLRLPIAAVTDSLDGRLAALSMLAAFLVAAGASCGLVWQVRCLLRAGAPIRRAEAVATAGFAFVVTGGSVLLVEASQVSVYHESAMWGIALCTATFTALLRHLCVPSRRTLVLASALATATIWSRASLGVGAVGALGLLLAGEALAWKAPDRRPWLGSLARQLRPGRSPSGRAVLGALAACLVPVLSYVGVNEAKFGTAISVPWTDQVFTDVSTPRREFLEANDGTFFGLQFLPTSALSYLRPDAFAIERQFPWIGYRTGSIGSSTGLGGVRFDKIDATSSIPVAFPLLGVLAAAGILAIARPRRDRTGVRLLTGPLLGASAGAATIFVFGFIAHRYLGDVLPALVVAGGVGFVSVGAGIARLRPGTRRLVIAALVLVGAAGAWTSFAHALWYQRVFASPGSESATAAFYADRRDLPSLPVGRGTAVNRGEGLPERGQPGELFVVGDCDGLYVSDGATVDELSHTNWKPVVRTPAVGAHELAVSFDDAPDGTQEPILVAPATGASSPAGETVISVEHLPGDRVRFHSRSPGSEGTGPAVEVEPGRTYRMHASADPHTDFTLVVLDGQRVLSGFYPAATAPVLGRNTVDASTLSRFGGTLRELPVERGACESIVASVDP